MIDEKKLIKEIDYYIEEAQWGEKANEILAWCKEIIKNQSQRKIAEWIPCSRQLPEPEKGRYGNRQKRTVVLACQKNGVVKEMMFEFATNDFWEMGDDNPVSHWKDNYCEEDYEIVAWQPMPEPYKGE